VSYVSGNVSQPLPYRWKDALPRLPAQTDSGPQLMNPDHPDHHPILIRSKSIS
jgi:hypothetical protein